MRRAHSQVELSFAAGEPLFVLNVQAPEGWLMARNPFGAQGLVPESYVRLPDGSTPADSHRASGKAADSNRSGTAAPATPAPPTPSESANTTPDSLRPGGAPGTGTPSDSPQTPARRSGPSLLAQRLTKAGAK